MVAATAAAAVCMTGLVVLPSAQAVDFTPYIINGTIDQDSTVAPVSFIDDPEGAASEYGPKNGATTKINVINTATPPMLDFTSVTDKVDLKGAYLGTAQGEILGVAKTFLYFGWERETTNGSGMLFFEFMKNGAPAACDYSLPVATVQATCNPWANRTAGDFIIIWDQQGTDITIKKRVFNGTAFGPVVTLDTAAVASSSDGKFGEARINATQDIFPPTTTSCTTFTNIVPGTITGNSDSADYKDVVLTNNSPTVSNCGSIKVVKDTNPEGGTGSFPFTVNRTGNGDIKFDHTKSVTRTLTEDGDSETIIDLIPGTDYSLTENLPTGSAYALDSIVCDKPANATGSPFSVVAGQTTECLITNRLLPGTLNVHKLVVNDHGGTDEADDFSVNIGSGPTQFPSPLSFGNETPSDNNALTGLISQSVVTGTYSVTEVANTNYTTTYSTTGAAGSYTSTPCSVTVPAGGSADCYIINDDKPATLTVNKIVVNDNGGTSVAADFTFGVSGGVATGQAFGNETPSDNNALTGTKSFTVGAGTYTVTEDAKSGYTTTYSTVGANGPFTSTPCSLQVANGGSATCWVKNDDNPAAPSGVTDMSWVLHDSLAISGIRPGAATPASVTFRVYSDSQCSVLVGSETDSTIVSGAANTTTGVAVNTPGTYYWTAQYSGDQFNTGFTTACGSEVTSIGVLAGQ